MGLRLKYKDICITGASGFIGSYLTKYLDKNRIKYKCFTGNLLKSGDIEKFFSKNKTDQVIHLVGSFDLPFENQLKLNVLSTQNLLEIGIKYGLKKIIFASSGVVYGDPIKGESKESDPLKPNTLYGLSKMFTEECIRYYAINYGLKYIILRFSHVYGSGNNKGVIFNFLRSIKERGKVIIYGNGKQTRDFLYISDAVEAIIKTIYLNESNEIFNIGTGEKKSLLEVVSILKAATGKKISLIFKKKEHHVVETLALNIQKAKIKLNWNPIILLQKGLLLSIRQNCNTN